MNMPAYRMFKRIYVLTLPRANICPVHAAGIILKFKQMKNFRLKIFSLFVLCFISAYFFYQRFNFPRLAYVAEVVDGDTVRLANGQLLRYLGLNTAESRIKTGEEWIERDSIWAKKASEFNIKLTAGKKINIEYDKQKKDTYGRLLGYAFINGEFVNELILREGLAVIDIRAPNFKYLNRLSSAFKQSQDDRSGIWSSLKKIDAKSSSEHEGDIVIVEDRVLDIYQNEHIMIILMPYGLKNFIYKGNAGLFSHLGINSLKGRMLRVSGIVNKYKTGYRIVIHHPYQIEVLP